MKIAKISALVALLAVMGASAFAQKPNVPPTTTPAPNVVKSYTRKTKTGKIVTVKSFTRKPKGALVTSKTVAVKSYTRKLKSGKVVTVKSYTRKAAVKKVVHPKM